MVGRLFAQDPNLYGDIILSSDENIEMIRRFHSRFGEALEILDGKDKAKFVDSFNQVSDWFGDYSQQFLQESQNLLKQAEEKGGLEKYDEVWIKPHPGLTLDFLLKDFKPKFKFNIVTRPIIELMEESDVAYCANSTGASLEAAWIGVPLIILAAYDSINLNPLFGFSDQTFIKDCAGLVSALENPKTIKIPEDYFFLDEKLLSWKNLLESTELPKPL